MSSSLPSPPSSQSQSRSASPTRPDFPFYNGLPAALSGRSWAMVLFAVALGFAALNLPLDDGAWRFIPALLFPLIPLLTLRAVAGPQTWSALFRRPSLSDLLLALGIALLNILVTLIVAAAVTHWLGANANPAVAELGALSAVERALFFAATIPQLLGEEVLTLLPLLALLSGFSGPLRMPRRRALILAWLISALPFALLHLPTYQWNLPQCLLVIGTARLVLSLAYLRSRNLVVATLAHVLNDWMLFGGAIALGGLSATSA